MALDEARRKAAGHVCLTLFHLLSSSVIHPMLMVIDNRHEGLGKGLTPKERDLMHRVATDLRDTAELMRKLGWRLLGR